MAVSQHKKSLKKKKTYLIILAQKHPESSLFNPLTSMREKLFVDFLEGVFVHSTIGAFLLESSIHHPDILCMNDNHDIIIIIIFCHFDIIWAFLLEPLIHHPDII